MCIQRTAYARHVHTHVGHIPSWIYIYIYIYGAGSTYRSVGTSKCRSLPAKLRAAIRYCRDQRQVVSGCASIGRKMKERSRVPERAFFGRTFVRRPAH
jgi:hypothetical protein